MMDQFIKVLQKESNLVSIFLSVMMFVLLVVAMCFIDIEIKEINSKLNAEQAVTTYESIKNDTYNTDINKYMGKNVVVCYYRNELDKNITAFKGQLLKANGSNNGYDSIVVYNDFDGIGHLIKCDKLTYVGKPPLCFISTLGN